MNRQFLTLFLASLFGWAAGNGLFPLMPVYALELGASTGASGMILAAGFTALAAGSLLADRIARAVGSRKWAYVGAALLQVPAYALMGHASSTWQLMILLVIAWLSAGITTTLINVITGLAADAAHRGRTFGLLSITLPLGALLGASGVSFLVAEIGYRGTFEAAGLLVLGAPLLAALGLPGDRYQPAKAPARLAIDSHSSAASTTLMALLLAVLLSSTALFLGRLGTSVIMRELAFRPEAIAGTVAVGGLVSLPIVPLVGSLSDRMGRRRFLIGTYLLLAAGLSMLAVAHEVWHFYVAAALLSIGATPAGPLASALTTDVLPSAQLARGLARLAAAGWIAAIIGFAAGGYLIDQIAGVELYLGAALLAASAILPLSQVSSRQGSREPVPAHVPASAAK